MGFFGGGASVDLASPPAIGNTTPNTGAFTTLSATPPANTTAFSSTGYSLTGTNAQTLFNLAGTWNTTGTPTAVLLNITDTASNASSVLFGMQIGGNNRFQFFKDGRLRFNVSGTGILGSGSTGIEFVGDDVGIRQNNSTGAYKVYFGNAVGFRLGNNYYIGWSSGTYADNSFGTIDLTILRDGADALAQRRTTNAQTFRLYNTFTDASNYERGFLRWSSNVFEIGHEVAGTGVNRNVRIITRAQTGHVALGSGSTIGFGINGDFSPSILINSVERAIFAADGITLCNDTSPRIAFSAGAAFQNDLIIRRDAAHILAQRYGTNAQTFRIYNTFTDASNYERGFLRWASNVFEIGAEAAGTGTLRGLKIGTATTSLIGFYGVTPVGQPATVTDPTGGLTVDAEARTAINAIIDRLQELGLVA